MWTLHQQFQDIIKNKKNMTKETLDIANQLNSLIKESKGKYALVLELERIIRLTPSNRKIIITTDNGLPELVIETLCENTKYPENIMPAIKSLDDEMKKNYDDLLKKVKSNLERRINKYSSLLDKL